MSRRQRAAAADADESIYNLIPQPVSASSRPALYRSKYPHDTPPTGSTFGPAAAAALPTTNLAGEYTLRPGTHRHKQATASFGPKNTHHSDPTAFQSANSQPELPQPTRFEYGSRTKPPLETRFSPSSPVLATRTMRAQQTASKNFISENALAVIMADARRPVRGEVDYLRKEDFGKVPAYLSSVKAEVENEKAYIRRVLESERAEAEASQPKTSMLPEEERVALLHSLKLKWEAVNKQYQTTTHMTVLSPVQLKVKEQYETELQQIEKSIEKLSKPYVFVQAY